MKLRTKILIGLSCAIWLFGGYALAQAQQAKLGAWDTDRLIRALISASTSALADSAGVTAYADSTEFFTLESDRLITGKWTFDPTGGGTGFQILTDIETTGFGIVFDAPVVSGSGGVLNVYSNSSSFSSSTGLMQVKVDHSSATGTAFYIQNNGTGISLDVQSNGASAFTVAADSTVTVHRDLNIMGATLPFSYINFAEFSAYPDFFSDVEDSVFVAVDWDSIGGGLFQTIKGYEVDTSAILQDIELFLVIEVPPYYVGIDSIPYDIKTGGTADSSDVSINIFSYDLNGATTSLDSVLDIESKDAWTRHNDLTSLSSVGRYDKILILIRLRSYGISWVARVGRMKVYWKEGS